MACTVCEYSSWLWLGWGGGGGRGRERVRRDGQVSDLNLALGRAEEGERDG